MDKINKAKSGIQFFARKVFILNKPIKTIYQYFSGNLPTIKLQLLTIISTSFILRGFHAIEIYKNDFGYGCGRIGFSMRTKNRKIP